MGFVAIDEQSLTVSALRAGSEVDLVLACVRKERLVARSGSPYLALELRDRSGAISARVFRDADVAAGRFERGDLVRVRARVERFRDELSLDVLAIGRASDADPAAFLPVAYRDLDELDGFLEHLIREVHDAELRDWLRAIFGDADLRAEFRRAPCTRGGHHAYLGGLLEHTVAVGTLALECCVLHPRLNSDVLITAALLHDLGKIREFTLGAEIAVSDEGRLVGHVASGVALIEARAAGVPDAKRLAVVHCVLTHHDARAAATPEAVALVRLNALDASVKGALEHGVQHSRT
jgi:3'-5' exoribonuclease